MKRERTGSGWTQAGAVLPEVLPAGLLDEVFTGPQDVGYTHPVFVQCFLPTRHTAKNRQRWQTNCGRASLVIRAGELPKPDKPNEYEACIVPAGPKARFVVAYVNDYIQRHDTATVNMGDNLRDAMAKLKIPIGGKNGKELTREVKNFAAAEIGLGVWDGHGNVGIDRAMVAPRMRFWIEKDPRQRSIWQPEMTVTPEYFAAVRKGDRLAPFSWHALVALRHDTRAMDLHFWLTYRLRNGLKRPVVLHAKVLHALFGQDVKRLDHFWPRFLKSLEAARAFYPQANIETRNDCIVLKDSPPLIPYRKILRGAIRR